MYMGEIERSPISRRKALALLGVPLFRLHAQTNQIDTVDVFPAFFQFWKEMETAAREARAARFLDLVVKPHADLFEGFAGTISTERASRYLSQVEPLVPVIKTLHGWVIGNFKGKIADFQKVLPEFEWRGSIVFMPNLFGFDAGLGSIDGKGFLVFGLDMLAKMDGSQADLSVLITHELFHLYHESFHPEWKGQTRGKDIPLYRLVWGDGLATYASRQLNPQATVGAILRSPTLAASCQDRLKPLAGLLLQNLDNNENAPFMEWMSGRARGSDVPPRAGYYFGWRIAQELGRQQPLPELARLSDAKVRSAMARELHSLIEH
jgi:hypothetical protein